MTCNGVPDISEGQKCQWGGWGGEHRTWAYEASKQGESFKLKKQALQRAKPMLGGRAVGVDGDISFLGRRGAVEARDEVGRIENSTSTKDSRKTGAAHG